MAASSGTITYRWWTGAVALTVAATLAFAAGTFIHHVNSLKVVSHATFESRLHLTRQFLSVSSAVVRMMRDHFTDAYTTPLPTDSLPFSPLPQQSGWQTGTAHSTTSGTTPLPADAALLRELVAANRMSVDLNTVIEQSPEMAWLYFLSYRGFLHLIPQAPPEQIAFSTALFERSYWLRSLPSANPQRQIRVSGPYQDAGGKGTVLTLSVPIYDRSLFLGIAALDLRIGPLTEMLNIGLAGGHTMLLTEENTSADHPLPTFAGDGSEDWEETETGELLLSGTVLEGELWLIHHLPKRELYLAAAHDSLGTWLALLLTAGLCIAAFRVLALLRQISRMTYHDALTGLPNRRLLEDRLVMALPPAHRHQHRAALLFIDLDRFKPVNDQYGHAVGDWLLQQAADRMNTMLRAGDTLARLGGDEFVVLLPTMTTPNHALVVAEKLRQALEIPFDHPACGRLEISSSIGVALFPDHAQTAGELLRFGDEAMYEAKKAGRNKVTLFSDQQAA